MEKMTLADLDSRTLLGTDIEYSDYPDSPSDIEASIVYPSKQTVRVIVGRFGQFVRMSAPELGIVVEGSDQEEAWANFLGEIRKRDDGSWLTFDVGPTRDQEIAQGLNAPEDEDWSEPVGSTKG
ncbi:MAG: hypothetical protein JRI77_14960 [Deltaproteobacteria bacterium]|nr:hypothetical protein [Deltaproteobacteria bacterium]